MSEPQDPARRILESYRNFAVVGCSPNPGRPSHKVAAFLQSRGYRVIPVHPAGGSILGKHFDFQPRVHEALKRHRPAWERLVRKGEMVGGGLALELRNCPGCDSTLAVHIKGEAA